MRRKRGIFLITTLFVVMFLTIMGTAVMSEIMTGMQSSGSFSNRELALQAAESGLSYLQARVESNSASLAPSPDGTALNPISPYATDIVVSGFEVHELGYNVVGLMTDQNVETNGQMRVLFRASFNKAYGAVETTDSTWPSVAAGLPVLPFVSASDMRQGPGGQTANTFNGATPLHVVVPLTADIIVQGLVVRTDGTILAQRYMEGVFQLNDIGGLGQAPVSSGGDINLALTGAAGSGALINVNSTGGGAPFGLSTDGNINIVAPDASANNTTLPTDYTSGTKAVLTSDTSKNFMYGPGTMNVSTGAMSYNSPVNYNSNTSMVQTTASFDPPAVATSQLPALSGSAVNVEAGTWVVYNNQFYHFPVAFQATNPDGTPMTSEQQPITVVAGVPNYNGIAPDQPPQASIETSGATSFNTSTSQLVVSKDLAVQPITVGASTIGSIGMVVAPSDLQPSGISNSLQVSLQGSSGSQIRASDAISVVGDVVGTGSVVIGPVGASPATVPADITVTGKSSLETGSNNGVAVYSTGNVNLAAIDPVQPPNGVAAGTGATSGAANLGGWFHDHWDSYDDANARDDGHTSGAGSLTYDHSTNSWTLTIPGSTSYSNFISNLDGFLNSIGTAPDGTSYPNPHPTQADEASWAQATFGITSANYTNAAGGITVPESALDAVATQTATGTGTGYDESFTGLVYSYNNFNVFNGNNLTLNGALVTFGGNPNTATTPTGGHDVGSVDAQAQSMTFLFNPQDVGLFANFFGGHVTLSPEAVTLF